MIDDVLKALRGIGVACRSLEDAINRNIELFSKNNNEAKIETKIIEIKVEGIKADTKISEDNPLDNFITIKELVKLYPTFTEGGIRSLIFFENQNNFNKCFKRIGRKIVISKKDFVEWINTSGGKIGLTAIRNGFLPTLLKNIKKRG